MEEKGALRPSYATIDQQLFLYHSHFTTSIGRWMIGLTLDGDETTAVYSIHSWSITPPEDVTHSQLHDNTAHAGWRISRQSNTLDSTVRVTCVSADADEPVVYFETYNSVGFHLNGFYIQRNVFDSQQNLHQVYARLKQEEEDPVLVLHHFDGKWIIGSQFLSDMGIAYVADLALEVSALTSTAWRVWIVIEDHAHGKWVEMYARIISRGTETSIYAALIRARQMRWEDSNSSSSSSTVLLRNQVRMPRVGLGTGGIYWEQAHEVFSAALKLGYSMFDSAREYHNEHILGDILHSSEDSLSKHHVFVASKVWPTQLGFGPTSRALRASLRALRAPYIDLYLLHWPECVSEWEWMHCERTEDPQGRWQDSWVALEKAYAEGRLMSIGVSNFDIRLLQEMEYTVSTLPHVVQNFAQPGQVDWLVHNWCHAHKVIFQPYASIRNIDSIPSRSFRALQSIAHHHNVSIQRIVLRYMIEKGYSIIPRATQTVHLQDNLAILNISLAANEIIRIEVGDNHEDL